MVWWCGVVWQSSCPDPVPAHPPTTPLNQGGTAYRTVKVEESGAQVKEGK